MAIFLNKNDKRIMRELENSSSALLAKNMRAKSGALTNAEKRVQSAIKEFDKHFKL